MKYSGYYMKYSVLYHFSPATFHAILRKIDFLWDSVWQGWCKDWSTCCLDGRIDVPGSQLADNLIALASHGSSREMAVTLLPIIIIIQHVPCPLGWNDFSTSCDFRSLTRCHRSYWFCWAQFPPKKLQIWPRAYAAHVLQSFHIQNITGNLNRNIF